MHVCAAILWESTAIFVYLEILQVAVIDCPEACGMRASVCVCVCYNVVWVNVYFFAIRDG